MDSNTFTLGSILLGLSGLFVLATLFFGTKGGLEALNSPAGPGAPHRSSRPWWAGRQHCWSG